MKDDGKEAMNYKANSFIAVRNEHDYHVLDFWVGKVLSCIRGISGKIGTLKVHWYGFYESFGKHADKYKAMYTLGTTICGSMKLRLAL